MVLVLNVIKHQVSLVLAFMFTKLITTFNAARIILIDCVAFMYKSGINVFSKVIYALTSGKNNNFDGLVFINKP